MSAGVKDHVYTQKTEMKDEFLSASLHLQLNSLYFGEYNEVTKFSFVSHSFPYGGQLLRLLRKCQLAVTLSQITSQ